MEDRKILKGSATAAEIRDEVLTEVQEFARLGVAPRLDVVLVGEDPASKVYVASKAKTCAELGMRSQTHILTADTSQETLEGLIDRLNEDADVDGILVQLPLPGDLEAHRVLERLDPQKDVDGFQSENVGLLQQGRPRLAPCTPAGVMELLRREGIDLKGAGAVVVGRSDIVGKPMAMMLLHAHATVTLCHSRTRDLAKVTRGADILIAAVGVLGLIGADHVRNGAVVVDVGMHRVTDAQVVEKLYGDNAKKMAAFAKRGAVLSGDVDFMAVSPKASRITPVPGGVGPLTIAMLMANTVKAARLRRGV
ncbi:MAG: bifunctional 5,10-methylenetetrahydrofolate dehydrogenase/5,10-methenyltetrahydrofolate cyclohydrolase [Thermoanaerobaculales bacterium]|nr:bifunctional 5,10-methylenetetrahydrofolate dehydrogenase/5,10-methenyltetrahydrofolate cyclohydrolase [Thermoanaerobaculales bacterium]